MADNQLTRFLGGPPLAVFVRLLLISLIVGAVLMWLDIRPAEIIYGVQRLIQRLPLGSQRTTEGDFPGPWGCQQWSSAPS